LFSFLMYVILVAGINSKFSDSFKNSSSVASFVVLWSICPIKYNLGLSQYKALLKISLAMPFLVTLVFYGIKLF